MGLRALDASPYGAHIGTSGGGVARNLFVASLLRSSYLHFENFPTLAAYQNHGSCLEVPIARIILLWSLRAQLLLTIPMLSVLRCPNMWHTLQDTLNPTPSH